MTHGDAVGPGAEGALSAESGEAGCDLEKAFLRCILGVCRALQDAEGDVVEPGLVPAQQRLQRARLAGEGEPHQFLVTGGGLPLSDRVRVDERAVDYSARRVHVATDAGR